MARVKVQEEDFDIGAEFAALTAGHSDIGGIGCFIGTVRGQPGGRADAIGPTPRVAAMTLEHYPAMTERAIARIIDEAERRWALLGCTVIHRVGKLYTGDNIVLVLAAAAHRAPALEATGFLIDWLKTRAPFWKREEFADGSGVWVEARSSDDTAADRWQTATGSG
jgi:molybdopterin synthase catalytic subunit